MATKTFEVTKQYMASANTGDANPGDLHIPLGRWTALAWNGRACLYAPINFSGMTAITSAKLWLRAHAPGSGWHAKGTQTEGIRIHRKTSDWSETSGGTSSSVDELWGGDGSAIVNNNYKSTAGGSTDLGSLVHNDWYSIDVTDIVTEWFNGQANYGVLLRMVDQTDADKAKEFWSRHSSGDEPYFEVVYSTNTAPDAPTDLSPTGDAVQHTGSTVTVSGRRSDPDSGDYISAYRIQVWDDAEAVKYFDENFYPSGSPTTFSEAVSGLPTNVFLKWRSKTRDKNDEWGVFTSFQRFKLNSTPNAPTLALLESPTSDVKSLTPTFKVTHDDPDASDGSAYKYQIQLELADGTAVWDSGEVTLGTPVTTVSKKYSATALQWATAYRWRARTQDSNSKWSPWSSYATFTTHATGVPVSLSPSGGTVTGGITPTMSGSRASSADSLTSAQIQVYSNDGVTLIWDSGTFTTGVTSTGFAKQYAGTALAYDTAYKWRARVTGSQGGTSEWSSLQSFTTPTADALQTTDPVGQGIADLTPDFEFSRTNSFNAYQIILYEEDGTTVIWDSGTVTHTSATSKVVTYPGTPALEWATTYQWKVRVSSDSGSTWGNGYTDLVTFETEEAGVPTLSLPGDNAWLGAPYVVEQAESLDNVSGSGSSTVTLETSIIDEGKASFKAVITSLNGSTDAITVVKALDLSEYGDETIVSAAVRASSLTNVSTIRLRFVDSLGAYAEYDIKPAGTGAFETLTTPKGSPDATSGTIDWSDIASIVVRVTTSASASFTMYVDDIKVDASNPSFDGSSSGGETIDTVHIVVYASDQSTVVWDSGDIAVGGTDFSVAYAGTALTPGDTYYWTAQYTEDTGPTGGFAALRAFSLNAAPSAPTSLSPNADAVVADSLTPEFAATFGDEDLTARGDTPSVFEVEVYRNSDDVLMHTLRDITSLSAGENTLQRTSEGTALSYEVEYKWRARYADSMGAYGPWSSYNVFTPSEAPTVTITAPGATVTSPSFDVVWTFSSPGGKSQNRFRVQITRDSDDSLVYDSGVTFSSVASHTVPGGFLVNSTDYTIRVVAYDSDGLDSDEATSALATAWAAPDAITGFSVSALEEMSKMLLVWDQTNLSNSDFSYYQIYRRKSGEEWERYATITDKSTVSYADYFAGHGEEYQYKITVWKKVVGDVDVESGDSAIPSSILDPDAWFVIGADRDESHIFELPVYDEEHTEPIQQEVFEPLGSRRKSIVRGKVLGAEGTLQVQWTDSERSDAKNYLRYLADNAGPHILKSPFGDVWEVEFSGPARKYTGGGHLGVTLAWIEVA